MSKFPDFNISEKSAENDAKFVFSEVQFRGFQEAIFGLENWLFSDGENNKRASRPMWVVKLFV
ncbi:MAG: hypothetical protein II200_05065 [Bacteroidaceae bacterium]|nr:hypothetical protein [Bacteroidaceae bacterium]